MRKSFVSLQDVRIYAYHGVLPEERVAGTFYVVNLKIGYPLWQAAESDALADTINYAALNDIIHQEMAILSLLLEHVAGRILRRIKQDFSAVTSIEISVKKENPPMQGQCAGSAVTLYEEF